MKCERYRDEIEEWLDGELAAGERSALERHLNACPGCAQYLSQRRSLGVALKKTLRDLGSGLHFQPRPISRRPVAERQAGSMSGRPLGGPARQWTWLRLAPRALTALAAVLIVALLFIYHPWAKPQQASLAGKAPDRVIMVSDSLDIANETFISGCYAGVCYSIEMQFSDITVNDHS